MTGLDAVLVPAGLTVHVNSVSVTLRAADARADEPVRPLHAVREISEGLDNGDARLLRRALVGDLGQDVRHARRPRVANVHRQGVLAVTPSAGGAGRVRLTNAVVYAFDVWPPRASRRATP